MTLAKYIFELLKDKWLSHDKEFIRLLKFHEPKDDGTYAYHEKAEVTATFIDKATGQVDESRIYLSSFINDKKIEVVDDAVVEKIIKRLVTKQMIRTGKTD